MTRENANPTLVVYFANHKPRYAIMAMQLQIKIMPDLINLMAKKG